MGGPRRTFVKWATFPGQNRQYAHVFFEVLGRIGSLQSFLKIECPMRAQAPPVLYGFTVSDGILLKYGFHGRYGPTKICFQSLHGFQPFQQAHAFGPQG